MCDETIAGLYLSAVVEDRSIRLMHICGTHEHTVCRFGLRSLLPGGLEIVGGPGCPVCVCPAAEIDQAIGLARNGVVLASFGDMVRVPSSGGSLGDARVEGADVRVVGSVAEAVGLARELPDREVVFFAVGFETTACTFAVEAS